MRFRSVFAGLTLTALGAAPPARAQRATPLQFDSTALAAVRWRELGPARGGRSVAVSGSVQRPNEYWMGTTGGGVFKTTDGGLNWAPMSDAYFGGTIGAVAVAAAGVVNGEPSWWPSGSAWSDQLNLP